MALKGKEAFYGKLSQRMEKQYLADVQLGEGTRENAIGLF